MAAPRWTLLFTRDEQPGTPRDDYQDARYPKASWSSRPWMLLSRLPHRKAWVTCFLAKNESMFSLKHRPGG
ncbi:hypothetical protein OAA27_01965 [bacterium]|nr:hypothetical protein [bacterium]